MRENILFINPAINPLSQNKIINSVINTTFPTGLGTLAGFLFSKGVSSVRLVDEQLNFIREKDLPKIILSLDSPRIIGMSVLTINSKRAYLLAEMIKKIDSEAIVVVGGIHPTVLSEEALRCKGVDVVVRGEGEETFSELVNLVFNEKDYRNIAGISFRKNSSVVRNQNRPLIMNLDTIPPFPYYLFEKNQKNYPTFGGLIMSRGCPYGCIFCSSRSVSGREYRYFSIERIISEIKNLVYKYNQKTIWMMDDDIAGNRMRFSKLLDAIIEAKLPEDVYFHGSMRADNITDEILDKTKSANFRMLSFGMETSNESLMRLINKGETVEQVINAIKKTDQKGIAVATTIIFGLPGETRKERLETIGTVNNLPLSSVRFNILAPYPGTPVFEMLNQSGEIQIKKDWENFAVQYMWEGDELPYLPGGNNIYELIFDTMFANLRFYLSLKGIKRMLKSSFAGGNVIMFSRRWYFSPTTVWNLVLVVSYLIYRFLYVYLRMISDKFIKGNARKYKSIRDNLLSFTNHNNLKMIRHFSENNKAVYNLNLLYLEKVFENVLYERYTDLHRPLYTYLPFNYQNIPAIFRYKFQKIFKNNSPAKIAFPAWPYEKSLEELRNSALNNFEISQKNNFKKLIWPKNKQYSLVLTHDVESGDNWKWVKIIAEIEKEYGFKSSWNIVPKLYKIDYNILDWLISNGFEIGLHGYSHDNKLAFLKEDIIRSRIESVQGLVQQYKIKGFRSPSWLRSENLFKVLQDYFIYDCSVLDVDYISSAGVGGCCSIFPYKIGKIIELPTTLPYEFPIQLGVRCIELNNFWREKVEWIKENKGVVNLITHPDPFYGGNWPLVNAYRELLKNFASDDNLVCMLPYQLAEYFINHVN